jgi:cephalosporin hydroxylase
MEDNLDLPIREGLARMQARIMTATTYFGVQTLKCPLDFWVYQEILFDTKPDVIVEIGIHRGGSTLALAHLCDRLGKGAVVGCDRSLRNVAPVVRDHPRISLVEGAACASFDEVTRRIPRGGEVLVIEDSSHTYENTLAVLRLYASLIKPGGYFIIEDGICHHGLAVGPSPGPYEAIETFLAEDARFEADRSRESFFITWNPNGYLRRRT